MRIGLVGKPNVGKSTFFVAATLAEAEIGNYPFTTINANRGMAYVRVEDPGAAMGVTSTPRTGKVIGDIRYVPVEVTDVAGLVPGAHEGKGLGNRFLNDLSRADVLVHVVDASGGTDAEGVPGKIGSHDPLSDLAFLELEIDAWIQGLLEDGWERVAKRVQQEGGKIEAAISERLLGIGITEAMANAALRGAELAGAKPSDWPEDAIARLAKALREESKPMVVALNKADLVDETTIAALQSNIAVPSVVASAQAELALAKAVSAGVIEHAAGTGTLTMGTGLSDAQRQGLEYIQSKVLDRFGETGVHRALEVAVFEHLKLIPVFPVEDESKLTDKEGRVLPDCHLVAPGTTAKELAYRVHTDLGDHFVRGVDCRTKRVIGADHQLSAGDVIKIAAAR